MIKLKSLKLFSIRLLLPLFLLLTTVVYGQIDFTAIHYRGIRPDDWNGLMPIRNQGRGFMINDTIDLSLKAKLLKMRLDSTSNLKRQLMIYESDSITMVQVTLYLPTGENITIADSTLRRMQIYFDFLRVRGLKCMLHLTFKAVPGRTKGTGQTEVLFYKNQLQNLLDRNKDIILEEQEGLMGFWGLGKDALVNGFKAAIQLRINHLNSLGLMGSTDDKGNAKQYSMENWRNVPVGPDQLLAEKMPFSDDYFKSSSGNIVQRPLFDYIRDHMGYRIELQQLMLPAKRPDNSPIHLKLELINRGFSAVKYPCSVAFVLIDPTGKVYELPSDSDPSTWQPFVEGDVNFKPASSFVEYKGKLPLHLIPGRYKLGVWIADASTKLHYDSKYDIRCANGNMGWWISRDGQYGINILTSLTISK